MFFIFYCWVIRWYQRQTWNGSNHLVCDVNIGLRTGHIYGNQWLRPTCVEIELVFEVPALARYERAWNEKPSIYTGVFASDSLQRNYPRDQKNRPLTPGDLVFLSLSLSSHSISHSSLFLSLTPSILCPPPLSFSSSSKLNLIHTFDFEKNILFYMCLPSLLLDLRGLTQWSPSKLSKSFLELESKGHLVKIVINM